MYNLKKANHIGRLADFTNQAAKKNLICIAFSNLHGQVMLYPHLVV